MGYPRYDHTAAYWTIAAWAVIGLIVAAQPTDRRDRLRTGALQNENFVRLLFCLIGIGILCGYGALLAHASRWLPGVARKDVWASAGGVIVSLGFLATVYQIGETRRQKAKEDDWERTKFLAKEMENFHACADICDAKKVIDSLRTGVPAIIMLKHQNLVEKPTTISYEMIARAFAGDAGKGTAPTQQDKELAYKFDAALNYFVRFQKYIETGLVGKADIMPYVAYWYEVLFLGENVKPCAADALSHLRLYIQRYYECILESFPLEPRQASDTTRDPKG